jgi:hypothetical protein
MINLTGSIKINLGPRPASSNPNAAMLIITLTALFAFGLICAPPAAAAMHFVHPDGLFNFSLKSNGWFDNPLNDQLFFNLTPALSLICEDDSRNVLLTISPLNAKMYGETLERAYEVMIEKISLDKANMIFLKNDFRHNDIMFKDIIYKDRNDLSNVRIILASDMKKTSARDNTTYAAIFYYPTSSDFVSSEGDVNFLLKTFMYKTQLAEPLDDNLVSLGKGADCIGEYISLYETSAGIVGIKDSKANSPLFKNPLVKFSQSLETNDGITAFKLNDGTLGFVNSKSKLDFLNMASLKLERGELIVKTQQQSSSTTIFCGNFIKLIVKSGLFSMTVKPSDSTNISTVTLNAYEGGAEAGFESNISPGRALNAGQSLIIEISDAGKLISINQAEVEKIKIDSSEPGWWFGRLITHKVVEAIEYLDKIKSYGK